MQPNSIFETHIIVAPSDQGLLFAFAKHFNHTGVINPRATCAQTFYGLHPVQPMLTYWYSGQQEDAVHLANKTAADMNAFGMNVARVKVEASISGSVVPAEATGCHYFEFHFKVNVPTNEDWNRLAEICATHGAHLFYNPYSKTGTMVPVVTLRRYDTAKRQALVDVETLVQSLDLVGFEIIGGMEREYSVVDSNVHLDKGWLFEDDPKNFITGVPTKIPVF